jgi:uncharacterized protein (TIGR03032 family)
MAEKPTNAATTPTADEPWLEVLGSPHLPNWLAEQKLSLAFTTYQAGKFLMLGTNASGRISIFERTFPRCMGLCIDPDDPGTLWLAGHFQIWRFEDALRNGEGHKGYDRVYVPRVGFTTGDVDAHDLVVESTGRVVFVNTRFSCLATVSQRRSFAPLWQPTFISKLAAEDRCHLNGVALENGLATYVTACSQSDVADGWRDCRPDGGVVINARANEILARGLSMPHSPRLHDGRLYVHNSGRGSFGFIDTSKGTFEHIAFCPGYLRGMTFHGDWAIVGLSKPRDRTFAGLPLADELARRSAVAQCGLQVINLKTGNIDHFARVEGAVSELYDVVAIPNTKRPMSLGFKTDEIQRLLVMDEPQVL